MQHTVVTSRSEDLAESDRMGMFRLRAEVFQGRLGWDVHVTDDGLEIDRFDQLDQAHYIIAKSSLSEIDACWRLLPTTGPNMLRDVFPGLMHGQPVPAARDVWELSRFAVSTTRLSAADSAGTHQFGFGEISFALMKASAEFGLEHGIARYVTVTTVPIERLMRKLGLNVHRAGPPIREGKDLAVACFIEIDDVTLRALER